MAFKGPESVVKDECKVFLESIGAMWSMPVVSALGSKFLDFVVCFEGNYVEVETKRPDFAAHRKSRKPNSDMTKRQEYRLKQILAHGGYACCVRSGQELRAYFIQCFGAATIKAAEQRVKERAAHGIQKRTKTQNSRAQGTTGESLRGV